MRNWTIKEAVEVIKSGTDAEAIKEIARINPLFVVAVAKDDVATIANMMGEKFTVRRLEVNGAVTSEDAEDDVMNAPEVEATAEAGDEDLNSMSTKQLMALCDKRGIKVPHYGKNKQFYLDALQNAGDATEADEDEAEAEAEETEEATDAYEGKSAMELFKECKKRGIKVEAKKNAKYYIAALKKADEAEAEEEAEDEADGWDDGDDDGEEEAPAKPAKATKGGKAKATTKAEKAPAKSASKSKAKVEAEDDDDEEWDI